jgi:hypothetical protein
MVLFQFGPGAFAVKFMLGSSSSSSQAHKDPVALAVAARLKLLRKAICDRVASEQEMVGAEGDDFSFLDSQDPVDLAAMADALGDGTLKGPFDDTFSDPEVSDDYPDPDVGEGLSPDQPRGSLEVLVDSMPAGASSSSSSSVPAPSMPVQTICPAGSDICDPSTVKFAEGYMRRPTGSALARVQLTRKTSTSYRCYQHSACRLMAYGQFPIPLPAVKQWIASAEIVSASDGVVVSKAKAQNHLNLLKQLGATYAPPASASQRPK